MASKFIRICHPERQQVIPFEFVILSAVDTAQARYGLKDPVNARAPGKRRGILNNILRECLELQLLEITYRGSFDCVAVARDDNSAQDDSWNL
jgi:hypothetical protein